MTDALPVASLREAIPYLRRPFTPEAVKFKVQTKSKDGSKGMVVAYIDMRLASERLNLVCPDLWKDAYEPTPGGIMWCHLTVDGITRSDVGEGKGKTLPSDALKRAAVKFGVGVSLYAVPRVWVDQTGFNDYGLTDKGESVARARYAAWLKDHGIHAFGEPMSHGDVLGAQGDIEGDDSPPPADPASDIDSDPEKFFNPPPQLVKLKDGREGAIVGLPNEHGEIAVTPYGDPTIRVKPDDIESIDALGPEPEDRVDEQTVLLIAQELKRTGIKASELRDMIRAAGAPDLADLPLRSREDVLGMLGGLSGAAGAGLMKLMIDRNRAAA